MVRHRYTNRYRVLLVRRVAGFLALLTILSSGSAYAGGEARPHAPGELLIGFRAGVSDSQAEALYRAHGGTKLEKLLNVRVHRIRVAPAAVDAVERALSRQPDVEFVERNWRFGPNATADDPLFSSAWHLFAIEAPAAWDVPQVGAVTVAIIDSGVDAAHPDLAAKLVPGYNFYDNNTNTADVTGHGTAVAGTVGAVTNNGLGVAAVAPQARLMPMRTSDTAGYSYASTIANALTWAADRGARVLNLSIGGVAGASTIRSAAQYVRGKGGLVVAAAGNCACFDSTPENPYILSVSATGRTDTIASFSSQGNYVDVSAPGDWIYTTNRGGTYGAWYGTSFASPVTAGVVALMMGANPTLGVADIERLLKATADDLGPAGWDPAYGHGRVNAARAVAAAVSAVAVDVTRPVVSITQPLGGATVSGVTPVEVMASDDTGTSRIDLYIDGVLHASGTTSPLKVSWDTGRLADGPHTLVAKAYDAAGNEGVSASVSATVRNGAADVTPPTTQIVSVVLQGGTLKAGVAAQDNVGVVKVELYLDGKLQASSSGPTTFSVNLKKVSSGTHTLQSKAYDAAGNVGTSGPGTSFVK